jgi:hypothetical protein
MLLLLNLCATTCPYSNSTVVTSSIKYLLFDDIFQLQHQPTLCVELCRVQDVKYGTDSPTTLSCVVYNGFLSTMHNAHCVAQISINVLALHIFTFFILLYTH